MVIDTSRLINQGDFCKLVVDHLADHGLKRGNHVYVAGMKAFPIEEKDPYTQRIQCLVHKATKSGEIDLDEGFYVVDPDSLEKVKPKKQEAMMDGLMNQMEQVDLMTAPVEGEYDH